MQHPKKSPKIRHLGTIAQICRAISLQLRHVSTIRKKNLLSSNISPTCPHNMVKLSSNISPTCPHNMVNFDPLAAEIVSLVWGTPGNFNGFRVLSMLLQRRRSTEVNQTLHYVWPSPGLVRYKYTFGISCPLTEFCHVQNSLCVHLCTIAQICRAIGLSSQLRHVSTIGQKLVKQQYLLYMTSQYGELRPTSG